MHFNFTYFKSEFLKLFTSISRFQKLEVFISIMIGYGIIRPVFEIAMLLYQRFWDQTPFYYISDMSFTAGRLVC